MQVICVINFDSVFLPILNKPSEVEAMFRPIILLDSLGIHILVYTSKEKSTVTKLFTEYATSEYFITEQDIVVISKNARINNKIEAVNTCIEYHNTSHPKDILAQKSLHQQVFVLDDDARFVSYINDKSFFNGILVDNSSMSHRWLLESFYNSVLQTDKQSHSDHLNALERMKRTKETLLDEDQTMLSMQHQHMAYKINTCVLEAITNLMQEVVDYELLKSMLKTEFAATALQKMKENNQLPSYEYFVQLTEDQRTSILRRLEFMRLEQSFYIQENSVKQQLLSLVSKETPLKEFPSYESYNCIDGRVKIDLKNTLIYLYLQLQCPKSSFLEDALIKLGFSKDLPTMVDFLKMDDQAQQSICELLEYYHLRVLLDSSSLDLSNYTNIGKEKRTKLLRELRLKLFKQTFIINNAANLCLSGLGNIKTYCVDHYKNQFEEWPAVPYKNKEENRYYWLRILDSASTKTVNLEAKAIAIEGCTVIIMEYIKLEADFLTNYQKSFEELLVIYDEKRLKAEAQMLEYAELLGDQYIKIKSARNELLEESAEKVKNVRQKMLFESTIFQHPAQQQNTPAQNDPFVFCREGNLAALKLSIGKQNNFNINQVGERGKTLLETALQHAHVDIVYWLVKEMHADVNFSQSGYHPVFSAIRGLLQFPKRIDILQTLFDANIKITKKTVDREGYPPLFVAARQGNMRFFSLYLSWGVAKGVVNLYGKYPKRTQNKEIKRRTIFEETILADQNGSRRAIIGALYSFGVCLSSTEIESYKAANLISVCLLKFLESMLNQQVQKIKPQLMQMSFGSPRRNTASAAEIPESSPRLTRSGSFTSLLPFFATEKVKYPWRGPLSRICASGKPNQLSGKTREELNKKEEGFTPLQVACIEGNAEIIEYLVTFIGVDVYAVSKDGLTAVHYLAINDNAKLLDKCVKLESLRKYGIDGSKIDTLPKTVEEINTLGSEGYAPIHAICMRGNKKLLEHLIKLNADLNLASHHGLTPLHYTVLFRHTELTKILLQTKKIKLLPDHADCTALHYAARNNNDSDTMQVLLTYCAQEGQLMVTLLMEKFNGESALTKAIMHADKKSAACFFAKGRILSVSEITYICKQLESKENQPEIRKLLFELYAELLKPYQQLGSHINAASPRPVPMPKSPAK